MEEKRVRELRARLGLSQERFAQLLGVSLQTVRRWEKGLTQPLPILTLKLDELQREAGVPKGKGGSAVRPAGGKVGGRASLGLGGLFKGIGSLMELVARMEAEGKEEAVGSGEVEALGGQVKGVYGFSVRLGLGGAPVIERFGNIRETETGPVVAEIREPLADVLDEGDRLLVMVELPGIEEKDLRLKVEGDILEVAASTRDRKYQKEILLPSEVDSGSLKSSYQNGILEIWLRKR